MNGDWIAQDIEDDVCCELNGNCTCTLEYMHSKYLKDHGYKVLNECWAIDEISGYVSSKVKLEGDPYAVVHILTTSIVENGYAHELE